MGQAIGQGAGTLYSSVDFVTFTVNKYKSPVGPELSLSIIRKSVEPSAIGA